MYIVYHNNISSFADITPWNLEQFKFGPQQLNLHCSPSTIAHHVFRPGTQQYSFYTINELIVAQIEQFDSQSNPVSPTK